MFAQKAHLDFWRFYLRQIQAHLMLGTIGLSDKENISIKDTWRIPRWSALLEMYKVSFVERFSLGGSCTIILLAQFG